MSDQITYKDKADLIVETTIDDIFKVSASDMNEIKSVVNGNADDVGDITSLTTTDKTSVVNAVNELNAPEKWISVGTTAPTDGRRVWFSKSKNLISGWQQGFWGTSDGSYNGTRTDYICTYKIPVKPNTTYTYSHGIGNKTIYLIEYGKNGNYLRYNQVSNSSQIQFTTSGNIYYVGIDITQAGQTISPSDMREGQLEEGPATSYEPYVDERMYVDEEEWFKKIPFEDVTSKVSVSVEGGSVSASDVGSINAQKFYHIASHIYIGNIVFTNVTPHYNNDQMQILFKVSGIGTILRCVGSGGNYDRQFASIFDTDNNNIYAYIQKGANASASNFNATYRCIFITQED